MMDDLEMTRLCAQAMGYTIVPVDPRGNGEAELLKINSLRNSHTASKAMIECDGELILDKYASPTSIINIDYDRYDPLHDEAQAMALVKKFLMFMRHNGQEWVVSHCESIKGRGTVLGKDLNRAIVECVAKLARHEQDAG